MAVDFAYKSRETGYRMHVQVMLAVPCCAATQCCKHMHACACVSLRESASNHQFGSLTPPHTVIVGNKTKQRIAPTISTCLWHLCLAAQCCKHSSSSSSSPVADYYRRQAAVSSGSRETQSTSRLNIGHGNITADRLACGMVHLRSVGTHYAVAMHAVV